MKAQSIKGFTHGEVFGRHGDVLIKVWDKAYGTKLKEIKTKVLHAGNNHNHVLLGSNFKIYQGESGKLLKVVRSTKVDHPEHGVQTIPPGFYKIDIRKEYDHFLEESRQVID